VFLKKDLFSAAQKKQIIAAIQEAEEMTSGEIRLHFEAKCGKDALERAVEVFSMLGMDKTEQKNATLIYLAWEDKKFAIIGDAGINAVVPATFWDGTKEVMREHFIKSEFLEGVLFAIKETGFHLKQYFPYLDGDKNELSNEISEG
jgi:uncharacterized membrane protein